MEPKEYEGTKRIWNTLCLSVVNKLFLTRKDNIKSRRYCLHRRSREESFPWPAVVVAAHYHKRLGAALRPGNNLWEQRKLLAVEKTILIHRIEVCPSDSVVHLKLCKRQFPIKAAFLLWQSLRLKDKRFNVLQYIRHHLFYPFASSTWHFPDTLLFTTSL